MKKQYYISVIVVVLAVVIALFFLTRRNKKLLKNKCMPQNFTENDAVEALSKIREEYGHQMAVDVEKVYRWETAHFKSRQFKQTGSPGMEAHGAPPYYGWASGPWKRKPELAPCGTIGMFENKGMSGTPGANEQEKKRPKQFLIFDSVYAAMYALAEYIKRYNGNYARWYSTTAEGQQLYRERLALVMPRIVNSLT